jgi:arabinose-5-phosphate isomerase
MPNNVNRDNSINQKIIEIAHTVITMEKEALERLSTQLDERFVRAVLILKDTLERRGKIVVVGIGKSGNIGLKIAATLNSTGATSVFLDSQNALHGDLGLVNDGDAIIALSYSGETRELLDLLPFIKRFDVQVISLTGKDHSTLASLSDAVIDTSIEREACPLNLAPTSSSTAMLVMGDALAMALLKTRGFTAEDFAKFHPGGSLGRALLTRVADIMRTGEQFAQVQEHSTVLDALQAMHKTRSGACVILAADGSLAGIYTHGDFARGYEENHELGRMPIRDLMTASPVTLCSESLAVEAVKTVGTRRIDDIVVVDPYGRPVGMIDSQDLARLKLV